MLVLICILMIDIMFYGKNRSRSFTSFKFKKDIDATGVAKIGHLRPRLLRSGSYIGPFLVLQDRDQDPKTPQNKT